MPSRIVPKTLFLLSACLLFLATGRSHAQMLDAVRAEGRMPCGVIASAPDWSVHEEHGDLSVFETEICRAVATAILGDPAKVDIIRFPAELEALPALKDGHIALAVGLTPSNGLAVQFNVAFGQPVYLDSERMLSAAALELSSITDLQNKLVCAMDSTDAERTLQDEMKARHITFGLQSHSEQGEMDASVGVAHCAAGFGLETRLADSRADFPAKAPPFMFLKERFGMIPMAPAWRYGDQKFGLIVDATISALVEAEALGITKANVEAARARTDLRAERLLGHDFAVAQALGLQKDWAVKVIEAVGNYGEIFDRTLGKPLRLPRGYNALWTEGGLLYPMPMQ